MKTIKDVLKIEIEKSHNHYRADAKILSGSPPVGIGKTEYEALYDLLAKLMFMVGQKPNSPDRGHLMQWTNAIEDFWNDFSNKL